MWNKVAVVCICVCIKRAELLEQLSQVVATPEEKALLMSTSDMQSNKSAR